MANLFTKWRNSHGFGVHSPFAFQIVKRVINPGSAYRYYAEEGIMGFPNVNHEEKRHAVKVHRLANMCNFKNAYFAFPLPEIIKVSLKASGCKIHICPQRQQTFPTKSLLIFNEESFRPEVSQKILQTPGNAIIIYTSSQRLYSEKIRDILNSGIIIEGNKSLLVLSRVQTQPVTYKMDL